VELCTLYMYIGRYLPSRIKILFVSASKQIEVLYEIWLLDRFRWKKWPEFLYPTTNFVIVP